MSLTDHHLHQTLIHRRVESTSCAASCSSSLWTSRVPLSPRAAVRSSAPRAPKLLAFEGEIALVIGSTARRVTPEDGWSHVVAITAANDLGVYDLRTADRGSKLRSKGADGFTPLGPALIPVAEADPAALRVRTWVNGKPSVSWVAPGAA
jgi:2-keto-4-pentenoate hydratase/2-oxohepta-3-ene-1,7-dioic acid hydratase in catechol pathway